MVDQGVLAIRCDRFQPHISRLSALQDKTALAAVGGKSLVVEARYIDERAEINRGRVQHSIVFDSDLGSLQLNAVRRGDTAALFDNDGAFRIKRDIALVHQLELFMAPGRVLLEDRVVRILIGDDRRELAGVDRSLLADDHALGRDEQQMTADAIGLSLERVDRALNVDLRVDKVVQFFDPAGQHHIGDMPLGQLKIGKAVEGLVAIFFVRCDRVLAAARLDGRPVAFCLDI